MPKMTKVPKIMDINQFKKVESIFKLNYFAVSLYPLTFSLFP